MTKSEFYVLPGSSLIGRTMGSVEKEYGVAIDRKKLYTSRKIEARLIIDVEGEWENVAKIIKA